MKLLPVLFIALTTTLYSQTSDTLVYRYADLVYPLGGLTSKAKAKIDYGDAATSWFKSPEQVEDEKGNVVKFKSPMDALNWMSLRGWHFVHSYTENVTEGMGLQKYEEMHFILRRQDKVK